MDPFLFYLNFVFFLFTEQVKVLYKRTVTFLTALNCSGRVCMVPRDMQVTNIVLMQFENS